MRCPTLKDLPVPPAGKTDWPWTEESPQLPERMDDGREWPRISIVTPSYNQGQFVEETIRSILLQGYPNLEYIVIDGGSKDESVEIIRKYEPWLTYWVSEPDRGQSHAINKGMTRTTGELVAWLNSDDLYLQNAFARVATSWKPGLTHWLVGMIKMGESLYSHDTKTLALSTARTFLEVAAFWLVRERDLRTFTQPEVFVSRAAWMAVGGLFEELALSMDYHLWAKLSAAGYVPSYLPVEVSFFRSHAAQKTVPSDARYQLRVKGERAWALYDALRLARKRSPSPPDLSEVEGLLEKKAGGYCRVLDAHFSGSSRAAVLKSTLIEAIVRPRTTIGSIPRAVINKTCFS
jgi:hypothetical protein